MQKINFNLNEIDKIAQNIIPLLKHKVVILKGEMGMGKTTLTKALAKALGVVDEVSSPTFSLVNEYEGVDNQKVFHFDFYRIHSEREAFDFGVEEYLYSGNWCFLEWSEKIPSLLPDDISEIHFIKQGEIAIF